MALQEILTEHRHLEERGLSKEALASLNIRISNKKIGVSEERLNAIKPILR